MVGIPKTHIEPEPAPQAEPFATRVRTSRLETRAQYRFTRAEYFWSTGVVASVFFLIGFATEFVLRIGT